MKRSKTSLAVCLTSSLWLLACEPRASEPIAEGETETGEPETESGEPETETGDPSTTTGPGFIPDVEEIAPSCDPFMQDCPDGEKCVPFADGDVTWNSNKCVPVSGDGQPGDSCIYGGATLGTDDCGADSICWDVQDVDGQAIGVCTSFCEGSADAPLCGAETSCLIANEGSITLCVATCDPLLQDCAAEGLGCYWANTEFNCVVATDGILPGDVCGYINDCEIGNLCASGDALPSCAGSACCTPFCELGAADCSAVPGTECASFFEEGLAPPGYESVGICVLPG